MHNAAEMFSFDPNPTEKKIPGPLLLIYFMVVGQVVYVLYNVANAVTFWYGFGPGSTDPYL
jgi:hypothetical protein